MNPWTKQKPTKPGRYMVRNDDNTETIVEVKCVWRGLNVYVPRHNETIPMSDIGDDEFEWRELE